LLLTSITIQIMLFIINKSAAIRLASSLSGGCRISIYLTGAINRYHGTDW